MTGAQKQFQVAFGAPRKPGRIRKKNEANIIRAAEVEFAKSGFSGTSLNAIAERAQIAKSNILYYFKSKHGLYSVVLADILQAWNQSFNTLNEQSDPAQAIYDVIRAKTHYSQSNPLASRIFAMEIIQGAPNLEDYFSGDFSAWINGRASIIQTWVDDCKIKPVNPLHLIFLIWSSTQHYADFGIQVRWALGRDELETSDFKTAETTLATIILGGLGLALPDAATSDSGAV